MPNYHIIDFLKNYEIVIDPKIQEREIFPFTMQCAKRFFLNFAEESFNFDREVRSILIYDGKENLPRHSFATGFLFSQSYGELEALGSIPKPIGSIHMEYGGNTTLPYVNAKSL